jgi:hypothetical protein
MEMKKLILVNCLILVAVVTINAQQRESPKLTGVYLGQKPPSMTPEIFAPGIVSKEGFQSKLIVNPKGSEIIFTTMTLIPGQGNSPSGRQIRFECIKMKDGIWEPTIILPFSIEFLNDEPTLSSDGEMLFFVSNRPKDGSDEVQKMPDIWVVKRNGDDWSDPQNLRTPVNTDGVEVQPFFSSDDKLYFGRMDGIYYSHYFDGKFSEPVKLSDDIFQGRVRGLCISPDNKTLVLHSDKSGGFGGWDLYCSFKDIEGNWMKLMNMGNVINTEKPETNATFSYDGNYLFFSRGDDIYWVSTKILDDIRPNK